MSAPAKGGYFGCRVQLLDCRQGRDRSEGANHSPSFQQRSCDEHSGHGWKESARSNPDDLRGRVISFFFPPRENSLIVTGFTAIMSRSENSPFCGTVLVILSTCGRRVDGWTSCSVQNNLHVDNGFTSCGFSPTHGRLFDSVGVYVCVRGCTVGTNFSKTWLISACFHMVTCASDEAGCGDGVIYEKGQKI